MSVRGKVAIIGVGMIPFGELFHKGLETMIQEAFMKCVKSVDKGARPEGHQGGLVWSVERRRHDRAGFA